jgi:hypothetical protein
MAGYIVAFSFGRGVYEEIARAKKDGFIISLISVQEILDKNFPLISIGKENKKRKLKSTDGKELF